MSQINVSEARRNLLLIHGTLDAAQRAEAQGDTERAAFLLGRVERYEDKLEAIAQSDPEQLLSLTEWSRFRLGERLELEEGSPLFQFLVDPQETTAAGSTAAEPEVAVAEEPAVSNTAPTQPVNPVVETAETPEAPPATEAPSVEASARPVPEETEAVLNQYLNAFYGPDFSIDALTQQMETDPAALQDYVAQYELAVANAEGDSEGLMAQNVANAAVLEAAFKQLDPAVFGEANPPELHGFIERFEASITPDENGLLPFNDLNNPILVRTGAITAEEAEQAIAENSAVVGAIVNEIESAQAHLQNGTVPEAVAPHLEANISTLQSVLSGVDASVFEDLGIERPAYATPAEAVEEAPEPEANVPAVEIADTEEGIVVEPVAETADAETPAEASADFSAFTANPSLATLPAELNPDGVTTSANDYINAYGDSFVEQGLADPAFKANLQAALEVVQTYLEVVGPDSIDPASRDHVIQLSVFYQHTLSMIDRKSQ